MKVCERAGRSASLRPLPPLPAALESAWSLLSSASSAAALWSLLSMLAVVITTTNAFIAIIIVTIILVAYHHQHLKLQIWRSVRSYQWNEHMLLVAMLMRGIILNFYCILDGMVSIHQLWLHRKRLKPSLKKAMKREAGEIFESYPGGYLSVIFDRLVNFLPFFSFETDLSAWEPHTQPRQFLLQLGRQRERRKDVGREVGGSNHAANMKKT